MMTEYLWLFPLGLLIGTFGTLIGAGGGFILVPILLLVYPNEKAELITSISLAVVFFNAMSGSAAYARRSRHLSRFPWRFRFALRLADGTRGNLSMGVRNEATCRRFGVQS
jgi:uncharacterized membrane protein YfcA